MAELTHSCPDCGSIDIEVSAIAGTAKCPNCDWEGDTSQTVGVASSEDFWDIERVGSVLLRVISKWGAGPMCQVFEFVGILDKDDKEARDTIMQAASAACIQAAFEAAHSIHLRKLFTKSEDELNDSEKALLDAAKRRAKKGTCPADPGKKCEFISVPQASSGMACRHCGGERVLH
jgi:hypothetical protein